MKELFAHMERHHGVVSLDQARAYGVSEHQVRRRVERGEWERVSRGVYRGASAPRSWHSDLMAAVLATGGVASHRTAAALWGLDRFARGAIEITVPYERRTRLDSCVVHRSTQWDRIDSVAVDRIPVTSVERTIVDLGAVVSIRKLELAAESALRQRLTTWRALRAALIRHSRRGRDGCGRLRRLLETRYGDEELPLSDWSRVVYHLLADRGVQPPTLEHRVMDGQGQFVAQVDLAWPDQKVAVELDSVRWHLNRDSFERDRAKRNRLRLLDWVVHEVTWSMTVDDPNGFTQLVRRALQRSLLRAV